MTINAGFDPGLSGAFAIYDDLEPVAVLDFEQSDLGFMDPRLVYDELTYWNPSVAYVEKVHSMPKQGVASTFKFGVNYGILLGLLGVFGCEVVSVTPQTWKKDLGLIKAEKDAGRQLAIQLFPEMADMLSRKKDHNRADALLIGYWGVQFG